MRTVSDGDVEVGVTSGEAPVGLGMAAMPLSAGQQRIWFAHGVTPVLMNLCRSYRLHGELDVDKLRAAVAAVVLRHAALRTTVHAGADGQPVAVLHSDLQARWIEHDVT
ncbi:condensation domain-containing protein, partial [Mycobacteroides abscessus]